MQDGKIDMMHDVVSSNDPEEGVGSSKSKQKDSDVTEMVEWRSYQFFTSPTTSTLCGKQLEWLREIPRITGRTFF